MVNEILQELVTRSSNKIINPSTGSVVRSLVEAMSTSIFYSLTMLKKSLRSIYVKTAKGLLLDLLALNFGLRRKQYTYATTYVTFTRTRDDIEEVLNAGAIVSTEPNVTGQQKNYILTETLLFPVGTVSLDGVVKASNPGTIGNTYPESITIIRNNSISISEITNLLEVANGVDTETDEEFRERIELYILSLLGGNERVIRSAALSVEGVVYTFLSNDKYSPGICYLSVNNQLGNLDSSIINEVREVVNDIRPLGVVVNVSRSPVKYVTIYVKLKLKNNFLDNNLSNLIRISINNYVNSLKPSNSLRKSDLIGHIEKIDGVDYIYNDNGQCQVKMNNDFLEIENINSNEMIRTKEELIEVEII
jgi:uncharacterized phage protein gp47/JayE